MKKMLLQLSIGVFIMTAEIARMEVALAMDARFAKAQSQSLGTRLLSEQDNPFPIMELSDEQSRTVAARIGYINGDSNPDNGKCIGCHNNFNSTQAMYHLFDTTDNAHHCFDLYGKSVEQATQVLNCLAQLKARNQDILNIGPHELGFMAAGVNHQVFKELFQWAGRDQDYAQFEKNTRMPLTGHSLVENDFELLLDWVLTGYPNLESFIEFNGPQVCATAHETFVGPELKNYVRQMSEGGRSWQSANEARGVSMFACPSRDSLQCFTQRKSGQDLFPLLDQWKNPLREGHLRLLHQYDQETSYWIRSSADGRFIANGGGPSAIIDLADILAGGLARKITVQAAYDPGFFPDNSGFMFQGSPRGSSVCEQAILFDKNLSHIDFSQPGCAANDLEIDLYQAIGNSLDSGDIFTLSGVFASDDGYSTHRAVLPLFEQRSRMRLDTIRRTSTGKFEKIATQSIKTPFHGNWMMSPAHQLSVATVSGSKDSHLTYGGYRLFLMDDSFGKDGTLPAFGDPKTASICTGGGEKPTISYDEQFLSWYRYADYSGPNETRESSADIWLFDLLYGQEPLQLTAMPKGFYAQFPHFRSDGWLYFSVLDAQRNIRYAVATDMVLRLKQNHP